MYNRSFLKMWARNAEFLIAALALLLLDSPASAQSQACMSLESGQRETLKELFRYSQLAERPSDRLHERTDCSDNESTHASAVQYVYPLPLPKSWSGAHFDLRLKEIIGSQTGGMPFVESPPDNQEINTLHVGCRDQIWSFDAAVEMRFYRRNTGADVVQLRVVVRPGDDTNADWVVLEIDSDGIVTIPGTALSRSSQAISNFVGEDCVFPAAKFAVYAMCEQAHQAEEKGETSDFRLGTENGKLTLVGHSLGGAAAQFIANSWPSQVDDQSWPNCPGVNAYAFGSIGLEPPDAGQRPTVEGTLISYVSACDWIAQSAPFSQRVQAGNLFSLSLTANSHTIDSIQEDLCSCLRQVGNHEFNDYGKPDFPPSNESLCHPQWGGA